MKRIRGFILPLLLLGLVVVSQAQPVPGYLGKKLIVGGTVVTSPIVGAFYESRFEQDGKTYIGNPLLDLNTRFGASVEYVVGLRYSLRAQYDLTNDYIVAPIYFNNTIVNNQGTQNVVVQNDQVMVLFGHSYHLHWRRYNYKTKGSIAPYGSYGQWGGALHQLSVHDNGTFFQDPERTKLAKYLTYTVYAGWGRQNILFDKLTIDYNMQFGLNFHAFATVAEPTTNQKNGHDDFARTVYRKMANDHLFQITVSIGYLP